MSKESHEEDQEQRERRVKDAGGLGREDMNEVGSESDPRKDITVNLGSQGLP
jgi:hypothetical protein